MSNEYQITKEKAFENLQLKDDFMFGVIMRNPKYCKPFLERILNISISHIEYPDVQRIIDLSKDSKSVRLDIFVEDGKNTVYNIEMQTGGKANLPKRTRYYQGMIDLSILEKGENYKDLKQCFIIFVCTFDLFGEGRHIYTFENRCIENFELGLGDDTTKIFLNTKGTIDDVTPDMKKLLDYIDGKQPKDNFTKELDGAVQSVRNNEKWRLDYMTLQMKYDEKFEEGRQEGKLEGRILTLDELGYSVSEIAEKLNQKQEKVFEILNSKD
ncbi:MAG: Rpn family recombination-promoting nuclease/putative transposase [Lachnospira sp.]|nr:Rpn family recombination-promoting nuclease/putative transposase [Lachnospira sp.]